MVVFVQIFMLHVFYVKWIVSYDGLCHKENSNKTTTCCAGYRKINGKCTECVGFYGQNCEKQCVDGYFGKSCKETCNCTESESCNQYVGCIETKDSKNQHESKETCLTARQMVPAISTLSILSFIMCFMLCVYRIRRQGKYEVDKAMEMMPVPDGKALKVQLIRYTSDAGEYRQYCDNDITKHACNKNFEKHVTHDYSRLIFPKFTSVDIPGDQYSTAIIRNPCIPLDEDSRNSRNTSNRGGMQESLRHSTSGQRSARNSRPYSLVHPNGFVEV